MKKNKITRFCDDDAGGRRNLFQLADCFTLPFRRSGRFAITTSSLFFCLLIFILSTTSSFSQASTEWNIFRGDQSLSGFSNAKIKFPMELGWTYQTEDAIVAAPVIGENTIFVSSIDGFVYALDFSGKMLWKFEADNSIEAPALFLNSRVYVGDFSGYLYCLDAKTGKLIWTYETENQIMGSPNYIYLNNKLHILVGSYDYYLHCVEAESGKNVWKYESDNFINGAPSISNNMAMFGGCDGYLHMVDIATGKANNKLEVATYIAGSVTLADGLAYTGDYDGLFSCIDLNKKELKWQFNNPSSNLPIIASPAVSDKKVVIGGQDKYLRCFDEEGGQIWSFNAGGRLDASPVIVKNTVITVTMDGWIYALDLKNGKEIWSYEIGSAMAHNPAVIDKILVVGARDGNVYFFEK
jgi:outer membrane protein assembly factor BamB